MRDSFNCQRILQLRLRFTETNSRRCSIAFTYSGCPYWLVSLAFRSLSSPTSFSSRAIFQTSPSSTIDPSSSVSAYLSLRSLPSTGFQITPASSSSRFPLPTRSKRPCRLGYISHSDYFRTRVNAACRTLAICWTDWGMEYHHRWICRPLVILLWIVMDMWSQWRCIHRNWIAMMLVICH